MPILQLQFKDKVIGKFRLQAGKTLTIGRRDSNDVIIENVSVSGKHAKVDSVSNGFRLMDLNSTNGTFVNDKLVTMHNLEHGDMVSIGKHKLIFGYVKGEKRPEKKQDTEEESWSEQTMVLDTEEHREMLSKTASDISSKMSSEKLGILSYLSGGEGEIKLNKKLFKIGKESSNDIIIGGLTMGKVAATISRMPNGYQLSYVGGMSKPKVNDIAVKETVKLEEFDTIEIGSIKVKFLLKD